MLTPPELIIGANHDISVWNWLEWIYACPFYDTTDLFWCIRKLENKIHKNVGIPDDYGKCCWSRNIWHNVQFTTYFLVIMWTLRICRKLFVQPDFEGVVRY